VRAISASMPAASKTASNRPGRPAPPDVLGKRAVSACGVLGRWRIGAGIGSGSLPVV